MALIVMPSLLSKRPWARIRARCEASFFIVLSKSVRCCSVRGRTYLTLIALKIGVTCHIALELSREILYQKTFGRALIGGPGQTLGLLGSTMPFPATQVGREASGDPRPSIEERYASK